MNQHQRSGETMRNRCLGAVLFLLTSFAAAQNTITERLRVDATDAPRNILHSAVTIPVTSGAVTLVYPKWIPGNHRTALTPTGQSGSSVDFQQVSLTRLVDSPLIAGANYRQVQLTKPGETPVTVIDMVGESEASIQITDKDLGSYKQLVAETGK